MAEETKRFYYYANGVYLDSCMKFPELTPAYPSSEKTVVKIEFGQTPEKLENLKAKGVRFQAAPNEFLLPIDDVATFWVKNGDHIIIQPEPGVNESEIRVFFLASAMGALAHQRKQFSLHASAIEYQGKAILFSGDSGLGKSTLAGTFYQKGYEVVTDDIAVIDKDPSNGKLLLEPGYAQLKLWEDSMAMLDIETKEGLLLRNGLKKYGYRIKKAKEQKPLPIQAIYALSMQPGKEGSMKELEGWEKFRHIKHRTFRQKLVEPMGCTQEHYQLLGEVCQFTPVFLLHRPSEKEGFRSFIELLENHFQQSGTKVY